MINSICVCGAGTMGSGIAQVMATAGFPTILYEVNNAVLQQAEERLHNTLHQLVGRGKLSEEKKAAILQQLTFTSAIENCVADLVVEAIVEKPEVKVALFRQLATHNSPETIFASNTSSLSIAQLAQQVPHPQRFAGLHFFNPAPLMKLVEVVQGPATSAQVLEALLQLVKTLGKTPVLCTDAPGFIVNRVARPYYIEALRIAEEGQVPPETIDRLLEARGFKLGPFKLMDLIGNDINYAVSCSVYEQLQRPERLKPSFIQEQKVAEGKLGKKTGEGYYRYP